MTVEKKIFILFRDVDTCTFGTIDRDTFSPSDDFFFICGSIAHSRKCPISIVREFCRN